MNSVLIGNIGCMISGRIETPIIKADSIYIDGGFIKEIGTGRREADLVVDANGLTLAPGLIDGHVHLSMGDWTPVQNCTNWISNYLHGGITSMVSAGELHLPGLPIDNPDPAVFSAVARVTRACYDNFRPGGVKVEAGTLLLVPGFSERDFKDIAQVGSKLVKFIFYPYGKDPEEQSRYRSWAKQYGLKVKIHSGGVSRSGVSRPAGAKVILDIDPDIAGHINGGPIPPSIPDIEKIITDCNAYLELAYCGNPAVALKVLDIARAFDQLHRIILGSDTPSGTGVTPRAMLRIMGIAATAAGVEPEQAVCMATGSVAKAHNLNTGFIEPGMPADLVLLGRIEGSVGATAMEALKSGNLLGISMVFIDGKAVIKDRSRQTPPPEKGAVIVQ